MLRLRRKLLADTLLLGVALTLSVVLADHFHVLDALENWAFDKRAAICQFFTPAPTTQLVHLDIDDRALQVIGRWPWPRATQAELLDELTAAKAKVVALDIVYGEPSAPSQEPSDPTRPTSSAKITVDNDAEFAAALQRAGNVIVPVQLLGAPRLSPIDQAMVKAFRADLELDEAGMSQRLGSEGFSEADVTSALARSYFEVRRQAAFDSIRDVLAAHDQPLEAVTAKLLKSSAKAGGPRVMSPLTRLIEEQYAQARAANAIRRLATTMPSGSPPVLSVAEIYSTPLEAFGQAAAATGFVDYQFSGDPVVRSAPLFLAQGNKLFPQIGLAMACAMLDVDLSKVQLSDDVVVLPRKGGQAAIRVPVRTVVSRVQRVPLVMYVPWFGKPEWQTMYDWPKHAASRQHASFNLVWDVVQTRRKIEYNCRNCDRAIDVILNDDPPPKPGVELVKTHLALDPAKGRKYFAALPALDDVEARQELAASCLKELVSAGWIEQFEEGEKKGDLKPDEREQLVQLREARRALEATLGQSRDLSGQFRDQRRKLQTTVGGKAVLIGMAASASVADVVSTPLHDRCPGVVVHGVIFNAIMTNHFWRAAPGWVTPVMTLTLGLLTAGAAAWMSPIRAMITAVAMLTAYLLLNGVVMFDRFGVVVGLAGPLTAIAGVWSGCVVMRTIIEARERAMITRFFQTYVDPTVVDYMLEDPKASLDGQVREMTVMFTDLANFTSLAERLGERSVSLLNDYMSSMVPIVRANRGTLNKFLGDGIMCFYGAPRHSATHAVDAVQAALDMQRAMAQFNQKLAEQGMDPLGVRAGVSTGKMVVGNAGSRDAADYTVLGDAVNFGSRLEGANKYLGTRVLVSDRTAELAKDEFLFRSVGRLRVVGKTQGVGVYEVMGRVEQGTDEQRKTVELTYAMVEAYQAGRFAEAVEAADRLDAHLRTASKLAGVYRERASQYLAEGRPDDFDGTISLTEK